MTEPQTRADLVIELWRKCLLAAREAGYADAGAVQNLIAQSRNLLGGNKRNQDYLLFEIYNEIHWDGDRPTDRVFETLLDCELQPFFKESGLNESTNLS